MSKEFLTATEYVQKLKQKPNNDEMSQLYGYYKQATVGDINIDRPGLLDIKGRTKWDSWNSYKGLDIHTAECNYIKVVNSLIKKYGV
jgi:diazepam-binding inhibitor (GABA receptor modulating acyl-CoA-binding protein)